MDFSILTTNDYNNPIIFNYNPFFKRYQQNNVVDAEQLFPDKLKNMNGHKIRVILYNKPPKIEFVNKSNEIEIEGINSANWKLTSAALNFTFDFVEIQNYEVSVSYILKKIETDEIDTNLNSHILGTQLTDPYKKGTFLFGKIVREAEICLIVPILYTNRNRFDIFFNIMIHSSITALIIIITAIVVKLCKFNPLTWTPFYIFALLFGITVHKKPLKCFERLVYIILVFLYVHYSSCTFAIFSDRDVIKNEEINYNALEEIKHPTFPIYMSPSFFHNENNYEEDIIHNLKSHSIPLEPQTKCYKELADRKDRFCLNSVIYAKYMIQRFRNPDNSSAMKIARPIFLSDFFVFIFTKGSQYINKFNKKFQQVLESGLQDSVPHAKKYFDDRKKSKDPLIVFETRNNTTYQLIIFLIGCSFSIISFVVELINMVRGNLHNTYKS